MNRAFRVAWPGKRGVFPPFMLDYSKKSLHSGRSTVLYPVEWGHRMTHYRRFLVVFWLAPAMLATGSRGDTPGTSASDDRARIQGTWQLLYAESEGKAAPVERVRTVRVEIKEGTHSVFIGDQRVAHDVHFTMDPKATPKTTDDTLNEGPDAGKQIHGIYELDGDTLISCVARVGQDRPKEFVAKPGSGHTLRVFKRVRAEEDPKEKAIREELMRFGGAWRFVEYEVGGQKLPIEGRMLLRGDRWETTSPEGKGSFKVDPTRLPKTIDVVFPSGKIMKGIYELTDGTYKVCLDPDFHSRPSEFTAKPGSKQVLEVLKREKP